MFDKRLEVIGVDCSNCNGACCRAGAAMTMTDDEVYWNRRKMKLQRLARARKYPQPIEVPAEGFDEDGKRIMVRQEMTLPSGYGFYVLEEDCGHLTEEGQCDIYDSPHRPKACSTYEVGSTACLGARQAFGVETPTFDPGAEL